MKKHLICLPFFFLLPFLCKAQQAANIGDVFCQMPDSILPYLSHNNKLDLVDFVKSGMKSEVINEFDDTTRLVKMSDDYMLLEASKSLVIEMKLLPASTSSADSSSKVLCFLCSYGDNQTASKIRFYTSSWIPLDIDDPILIYRDMILQRPDTMDVEQFDLISESQHPIMIVAKLSENDQAITLSGKPHIMSELDENKKQIESIYRQISLKWNGKTFKEN